jgi:tRNA (guanine37-N1)-methyltransferase
MLGVKAPKANAEKVRKYLAGQKLMVNNYRIFSAGEFIYFPIARQEVQARPFLRKNGAKTVHADFKGGTEMSTYRERLQKELGSRYDDAIKGYDIIGDIAVVESRDRNAALRTAKAIMSVNKNVKTVLRKIGPVSGRYRKRKYEYVAGERKYETVYRENGASFIIDVRKSFFSPRLAFERNRINRLVRKGENVMIMFAGVGPFAIEIAKAHKDAKVVAIELNRDAYRYMLSNIELNKAKNVKAVLGDVKREAEHYKNFADRIVMPLPKDSHRFLDSVLSIAKRRCIVHYYAFGKKDSAFADNETVLREFFRAHGRKIRIAGKRVARPYSPRDIEIVIDFVIS